VKEPHQPGAEKGETMSSNRLPSLPDGKARVSFDTTAKGASKVVVDIPTWITRTDNYGRPRQVTKFKRVQSSEYEMVAKFQHAIDSGWFEVDTQGSKFLDLVNISYFDNSFKAGESWVNFSELVTADIAPVEGSH
jgi:hypothetical protein